MVINETKVSRDTVPAADYNEIAATVNDITINGLPQKLTFTGVTHEGMVINNLTTTQRNALTPATGSVIWNTTTSQLETYDGATWTTGSSSTDVNAIHDNVTSEISLITEKVLPISADLIIIEDSAAANAKKKVQIGNLPSAGETNTGSNIGTSGVGVFKQKTGVDFEFKNINTGSSKITITDDVANNEIDVDVVEANLTLTNSQISDFSTGVSGNSAVTANTAKVTNATHTGDVTGSTALTVGLNKINDTHIDFGTGVNQVSTADVPEQTNLYYTETRVTANASVTANTAKVSADGLISTHSNVVLTAPATNEVLTYNGTNWVNQVSSGGGGVTLDITQTAHGLSLGNAIYYTGTAWAKAKSNASTTIGTHVVSAVADANNFTASMGGQITGLTGLTAGSFYYVSAVTAGATTATEPSNPNFSNPILLADSTTTAWALPFRASGGSGSAVLADGSVAFTATQTGVTPVASTDLATKSYVDSGDVGTIPAFHVNASVGQSIPFNTPTKMQFDTEDFDTNNNFDAVTNYRFTPTVAGKYFIHAVVYCSTLLDGADYSLRIYKNNNIFKNSIERASTTSDFTNSITVIVDMNGTTDYLEIFVSHGDPTNRTFGGANNQTYFEGFKIGGIV